MKLSMFGLLFAVAGLPSTTVVAGALLRRQAPAPTRVSACLCASATVESRVACHLGVVGAMSTLESCASLHPRDVSAAWRCARSCGVQGMCAEACQAGGAFDRSACQARCAKVPSCLQIDAPSRRSTPHSDALCDCLAEGGAAPRLTLVDLAGGRAHPGPVPLGVCQCTANGTIAGVVTGHRGCTTSSAEPLADGASVCYVDGRSFCPGAKPSSRFDGLSWIPCNAMPRDWGAACELSSASALSMPPLQASSLRPPPAALADDAVMRAPPEQLPLDAEAIVSQHMSMLAPWSTSLPPSWYGGSRRILQESVGSSGAVPAVSIALETRVSAPGARPP